MELDLEVLCDGTIGRVTVIRDCGFPRLTRSAVAAARAARFAPSTEDGVAVISHQIAKYHFELTGR